MARLDPKPIESQTNQLDSDATATAYSKRSATLSATAGPFSLNAFAPMFVPRGGTIATVAVELSLPKNKPVKTGIPISKHKRQLRKSGKNVRIN